MQLDLELGPLGGLGAGAGLRAALARIRVWMSRGVEVVGDDPVLGELGERASVAVQQEPAVAEGAQVGYRCQGAASR